MGGGRGGMVAQKSPNIVEVWLRNHLGTYILGIDRTMLNMNDYRYMHTLIIIILIIVLSSTFGCTFVVFSSLVVYMLARVNLLLILGSRNIPIP